MTFGFYGESNLEQAARYDQGGYLYEATLTAEAVGAIAGLAKDAAVYGPKAGRWGISQIKHLIRGESGDLVESGARSIDNVLSPIPTAPGTGLGPGAAHVSDPAFNGAVRSLNPSDIRFSQATVSHNFAEGGHTISSTAAQLRKGADPNTLFKRINVVVKDGQFISLDNRRLRALQRGGIGEVDVNVLSLKNPKVLAEFNRKTQYGNILGGQRILTVPTARWHGRGRALLDKLGIRGK